MRTLQEKYIGVTEDRFSKAQFKRDAIMECSHLVSHFNSFDDVVTILINRGVISEVKQENKYAETDAKPEDHIAPDILDTAIKFECDEKHGTLDVSEEEFEKCKAAAIENLEKDINYYVKKSAGIKDEKEPSDQMEKVTLKEGAEMEDLLVQVQALAAEKYPELDSEDIGDFLQMHGQEILDGDDLETSLENFVDHNFDQLEEGKAEQLAKLKQHRAQIMRDMEQEAEMEGGPIADKYGDMLNKIDKAIAQLQGTKKEKEYKLMEEELSADQLKDMKERLKDAAAKGEGLEDASAEELKVYAQIADQEEDHITQINQFEYLESLPNYNPEFTPKELREVKVQVNIPGQKPRFAEDGKEYSEPEADKFIARAKKHGATPMNTTFKKVDEKAEIHTAQDGSKHKLSYNVYVNGEKVANFEDEAKADAEVKRYREEYKDSEEVASSSIFVKRVMDPINEDYEPRTKEDLVYQYLRDAWQLGAMKGKDFNPDEELSTMADSLLANLPDYDSHEPSEDPDVEDLYQLDQEKLDQLKESFRKLVKTVIEG